jgi:uncharacterized membrane protein
MEAMGSLVKESTLALSHLVEACAAFVIGVAVLKGLAMYLRALIHPSAGRLAIEQDRLSLGHSLTLGLEFLIGADILRTAVAPSWADIGQLAAIVAIRTTLSYFLGHELRQVEAREKGAPGAPWPRRPLL